jgi:hypothetical protein
LAETGSEFFSGGLFWRQLSFGGNWLHIIIRRINLEAAQIWQELALRCFPGDCFGGSSDLAGTGFTFFSCGLFWRRLRFGWNWLHIIFRQIVLEVAQIWRDLAPHYFTWRNRRLPNPTRINLEEPKVTQPNQDKPGGTVDFLAQPGLIRFSICHSVCQ